MVRGVVFLGIMWRGYGVGREVGSTVGGVVGEEVGLRVSNRFIRF